jgi:exonuclease III
MKVDILSINVDGIKESPGLSVAANDDAPVSQNNGKLPVLQNNNRPDIYVEFSQEDARPFTRMKGSTSSMDYSLMEGGGETLVDNSIMEGMRLIAHEALNNGQTSQNIITTIYAKNDQELFGVPASGVIPLPAGKSGLAFWAQGRGIMSTNYSKGVVWVKVPFQQYSVLFINMHLPVADTSKNNMGFNFRKNKFKEVLKKMKELIDNNTYVIIGGDLNFRMSKEGVDQLDEILKEGSLPIPLKEMPYPDGKAPIFTCKFKEAKANNNCRTTRINNTPGNCFDKKRIPSRCDRFLIGDKAGMKVLQQDTAVFLPKSDHNAIFASIELGASSGGGRRVTRKRRSKSRRTSL